MNIELPAALDIEMTSLLGADAWRRDEPTRLAHATDDSRRSALPDGVALPSTQTQVAAIVAACRRYRLPLTARGAGTGTTGAAVPFAGGIVISFARMNRIVSIRPEDRCAVVEPGVINGDLQRALAPHSLFWPPDPSSADHCTVGGNLACNAGGPRAVKYGATRDNVLGLVAVTGAGDLVRCGGPWSKNATGYDLTRLIIGSEGSLALIVEATLRVLPTPSLQAGLRALYRDTATATAAITRLMAQPQVPTTLEFMDAQAISLLRRNGSAVPDAGAMLLVETDGDEETLPLALTALGAAADGEGLLSLDVAMDGMARDTLWAARRALSPALRTIAPGKINEDVVVPVSRIPELVAGVETLSRQSGLPIVVFGHAGNGNLHVNILYHPDDPGQNRCAHDALPRLFDLVISLDGTLSGEHGIGVAKRDYMSHVFDSATLTAMRAVKSALDPDGILNPGKLLPPVKPPS